MKFEDFEEKTINRKEIFKGHIIDVKVDDVELPQGLGTAKRELIFHPGAVSMIPITADNKIILVRQFRKALEKVIYEIPAGKLEAGEKDHVKEAALRELEEETGYTSENIELIYEFYSAPGFCNEKIYLYYIDNLVKVENPRPQDDDEVLEVGQFTLEECKDLIASEEIADAKTIMAIQYWELNNKK
ncbi:ADP-ribose pyrophosphatase [Floricoccus tropicus]|uniref:ADP-ribose pyrophosphatase n=1 Tax=Floricoccus tropicus TaxID=1859473 RepID=A0A1E8GMS7_9LACT|nr:NUDIX hydrolase [Floricoccus tropicus]OFI49477.1 ADP-ribose pyrophosphatase [Floricoccus tropicus]